MDDLLLFLHIPRTGGTTLRDILDRVYESNRIGEVQGLNRKTQHSDHIAVPDTDSLDLILGHFAFGLHRYIERPTKYIAFFRHPVNRIISIYQYAKRLPIHHDHEFVNNNSLTDYINSKRNIMLYNGQTRLLNGVDVLRSVKVGDIGKKHLEQVKANFAKHFFAIGITERFDESILYLQHRLDWKTPYYSIANKTQKKSKPVLDDSTSKLILEYNKFDMQLYMYANTLLDNQLETADSIVEAANDFKKKNQVLSKIFITSRLERMIKRFFKKK